MVIGNLADRISRGFETAQGTISEAFFEPVVRLGVTGLSRAGKTVFITSLVANLIDRGRMPQLVAAANGTVRAAYLQPQPDDTVPRFEYEEHLAALISQTPSWPASTRAVSELRLSFRIQPRGILGSFSGPKTVHLDIIDYPGEWLLDLGLLEKSFSQWSAETLVRLKNRPIASTFLDRMATVDAAEKFDEGTAIDLADAFSGYLMAAKDAGFSDCTPGRFLLPGDLAGSPILTFSPIEEPDEVRRGTYWREMERRYEAYKSKIVKPFFRDHFSRIDRQIVLVDALGAINAGPEATEDLRRATTEILNAFRTGGNAFLTKILFGRRVEKILFAATKADHIHHTQHAKLTNFMQVLVKTAKSRAEFAGAETAAMSIASLRTTVEETVNHDGQMLDCVRGTLLDGKQAAFYPGELPDDPARLLEAAREGATRWLDADYGIMSFLPSSSSLKPGEGPVHIRLDRAAQFLFGDKL